MGRNVSIETPLTISPAREWLKVSLAILFHSRLFMDVIAGSPVLCSPSKPFLLHPSPSVLLLVRSRAPPITLLIAAIFFPFFPLFFFLLAVSTKWHFLQGLCNFSSSIKVVPGSLQRHCYAVINAISALWSLTDLSKYSFKNWITAVPAVILIFPLSAYFSLTV